MAVIQDIADNIALVRNATYGKEVREAIARGLELCYGFTSGETAIEAAERANAAAEAVEEITEESRVALTELERAVANIDDIVKVSTSMPTEPENKIWIHPQDETEYKIATYSAYEFLWDQMASMYNTYAQGHGGIVNIERDTGYDDGDQHLERRYVITYSDNTTGEFFVKDGPVGPVGPTDTITGVQIFYHQVRENEFTPTPPDGPWVDNLPTLIPGAYLWTLSKILYSSGAQAYIYGLTKMGQDGANGKDGTGAVNSLTVTNGTASGYAINTPMAGDIKIAVDTTPTENSNKMITSGAVYTALQNAGTLESPEFTGTPTAPTPNSGNNSTQIATTAFVQDALAMKSVSAKQVSLTMNDDTLTYLNSSITENTAVVAFVDLDYKQLPSPLSWTTSEGQLTLSLSEAPSNSVSFKVLLLGTVNQDE